MDGGSVCKGNWDANTIYYRRDQVTYNGYRYQARWWTQGDVPSESGPWGVWRRIGSDPACQ
ncbi:carbohydrate-binding protein [Pseudoalteromonas sp. SW0106-04]|uniref:carbohydrate-binding protein n=1 Tax=Pseudoalteromonas sp. SW0106-04 TaxID=1702169 RepID=UPI0035940B07